MSSSSPPCRVVLLLDLDCFYAQCERVRLGLDGDTAELALLQWNSTLAVTYPARKHRIKRGDSWDDVRTKSQGSCLAIHLPILKADEEPEASPAVADVEEAYQNEYVLSKEQRQHIMDNEVGVKRHAYEGKACLERYRLASTRIFSVVLDTLNQNIGKDKFVLERASIDELFVDVTGYCWDTLRKDDMDHNKRKSIMEATVLVGRQEQMAPPGDEESTRLAIEMGCVVARQVRDAVFKTLGFTLSAGVSVNKTVAKLGASYGKPNGQAVVFPHAIPQVMEETKIRKVRNFGGKCGKNVQALLPPEEETMGSVARLLPLPRLIQELGPEMGKMVFDACRGIDSEPVKETVGALVKSITASKSFSRTLLTSEKITECLSLLATDVISRVEQDCARNERYPQSSSVHYSFSKNEHNERLSRSVRISFPRLHEDQKKSLLVERAREAVRAKEGTVFLYRIGLCANDFEPRPRNGISVYFSKEPKTKDSNVQNGKADSVVNEANTTTKDVETAPKVQHVGDREKTNENGAALCSAQSVEDGPPVDKDLEYARRLQESYDREDRVLMAVERKSKKPRASAATVSSKRMRLDNYFRKPKSNSSGLR